MSNFALRINNESWYRIFSYATFSYWEALYFCGISKHFYHILSPFVKKRKAEMCSGLSEYRLLDRFDPFWRGLYSHFPVWDINLTTEDCFVMHICQSLKNAGKHGKLLCYLVKERAFLTGPLSRRFDEYEKSFCVFASQKLNHACLYKYLKLRENKELVPNEYSALEKQMELYGGMDEHLDYVPCLL